MEREGSLPCSQDHVLSIYPEPDESKPHSLIYLIKNYFNLIPCPPRSLFTSGFLPKFCNHFWILWVPHFLPSHSQEHHANNALLMKQYPSASFHFLLLRCKCCPHPSAPVQAHSVLHSVSAKFCAN